MRLLSRNEAPSEDTPPSTRPSSAASSSTSGPQRSTSMDSLNTSSSICDKPVGEEFIPTRFNRSAPRVNVNQSMQFVKTKPAELYKTAKEQISKVETIKSLRETSFQEEEEWQHTTETSKSFSEDSDWQSNLDSWKNNRRKRNEEVLERVIAVKKYEQEEDFSKERRRGKTFSEMQQERSKRGRRYNFLLHDDENDLNELEAKSSVDESKDIDNKDAKSDAGFCTGSDTGSDGVFAEDNSSDTSSALGDKKEQSDSLIENSVMKEEVNGIHPSSSIDKDKITEMSMKYEEYTFEKALDKYKEYAENSTKRSPSVTSLSSTSSFSKEDRKEEKKIKQFKVKTKKYENFSEEYNREERIVPRAKSMGREKPQKVDIKKRRSMFELRDIENDSKFDSSKSYGEISKKLFDRVSSFENVNTDNKCNGIIPPRDAKFKEKLAAFNTTNVESSVPKKKPERDQNFYKKLENFSKKETEKTPTYIPKKPNETMSKYLSKERSSFTSSYKERSVSSEHLNSLGKEDLKRSPSTPFLVVNVSKEEKNEVNYRQNVSSESSNRKTIYEPCEKVELKRDLNTEAVTSFFQNCGEDNTCEAKNKNLIEDFGKDNKESFKTMESEIISQSKFVTTLNNKVEAPSLKEELRLPQQNFSQKEFSENYFEKEEDSLGVGEYGDSDIDEVIRDFSKSPSQPQQIQAPPLDNDLDTQNTYENIKGDEQTYENIYEKIEEPIELLQDNQKQQPEHVYQTLDEVQEDIKELSPVLPPKKPACFSEVLEMTWTEDSCRSSLALPPSVPPPPPPEEEEVVGGSVGADFGSPPHVSSYPNAGVGEDISFTENTLSESKNARIDGKKEILMKRSSFLGTSPYVAEEPAIKPPPDIKDLLRQERDAERQLIQAKKEQAEIDNIVNRSSKYTWEDRVRDDTANVLDISDSSIQLDFQFKLAELELEMEKHDRDMLQRVKPSSEHATNQDAPTYPHAIAKQPSLIPTASQPSMIPNASQPNVIPNASQNNMKPTFPKAPAKSTSSLPIQEFYTAPATQENKPSHLTEINFPQESKKPNDWMSSRILPPNPHPPAKPSRSLTELSLAAQPFQKPSMKSLSAIPKPKRNDSESWIAKKKNESNKRNYNSHWLIQEAEQRRLDSNIQQQNPPPPPKQTFIPPPPTSYSSSNSQPPYKNPVYTYNPPSHPIVNQIHPEVPHPYIPVNQPPETYGSPVNPPELYGSSKNLSDTHPYSNNTINNVNKPLPDVNQPYNQYPEPSNIQNSQYPESSSSNLVVPNSSSLYANMSQNNIYANQISKNDPKPLTYNQPQPPPPQKSLPESIINSITQRVTNKNRNQSNDRPVAFNSRYQNHDYMNSEEILRSQQEIKLDNKPSQIPTKQTNTNSVNNNNSPTSNEEQRLLSVSGKKKCSHCCEELGRGAAMIIESLRLFYHIPCFKCCVCGIQLGNGTSGADVRVRNHKLHCHNCYSNDEGMKFSKV